MPRGTYNWSVEAKIAYYTDYRGPDECWPWLGSKTPAGYARVVVENKKRQVIRLLKNTPRHLNALHHCDRAWCVNPDHIYNGTAQQNVDDRVRRGRSAIQGGETNGYAKLSNEAVIAIRQDRRKRRVIAAEYGVSLRTIFRVLSKETWGHI